MKRLYMKYIDNNFYEISGKAAAALCRDTQYVHAYAALNVGKVPVAGYEKRVFFAGFVFWLKKTVTRGRNVWALQVSSNGPACSFLWEDQAVISSCIKKRGYLDGGN